jgi:hypothetical protein
LQKPGPRFDLDAGERAFLGPIDADAMLAELERHETPHKRRLLIGERLHVLGEHPSRWGVGVNEFGTPRIDWQRVKGGEVTISILSRPNDPHSKVKQRTRKVESFQIACYPVTVAQYRAFLDAKDGWCDQAWWGDDLYRDPDDTTYGFGRFGNLPAVYVSWFDAVAFCRWLSRRLRLDIRLPDEWQWQQAATGGDDLNVFPWGADWDVKQEHWRANTFESRLWQPTAVGMYPTGATPSGAPAPLRFFQPCRLSRAAMGGRADHETVEDMAAQPPAVGVIDMGDPALDAGTQLGEADFARMIGREPRPQPAMDAALDLQEALVAAEAPTGRSRVAALREADSSLGRLRVYLRLAHRWRWLSDGQCAHAGGMVGEIGRLLGGWPKAEKV